MDGRCHPYFKQLRSLSGRHRPAKVVSLSFITAVRTQKGQLLGGLYAFCNHSVLQTAAHIDHRANDSRFVCVSIDLVNKRLIYLQCVDWKLPQITQARVTRPEVINGQAHPHRFQFLQHWDTELGMLHQNGFGQF